MKVVLLASAMLGAASATHAQIAAPAPVVPMPVATPTPPATADASQLGAPAVRYRPRPLSPAMKRVRTANREATLEPQARAFVNAAQVYPFGDGALYRLYAAPGLVSDIALQAGETIISVAAGDTARWTVGDTISGTGDAKRAHILVKPFIAGLTTNLVIATDRRTYHLQLESTSTTAMSALSWTYPQDELLAIKRAADQQRAATPIASGLAIEQLNFNYAITGDNPGWRPLRAFDDGHQTFIEFPPSLSVGEAPPLFVVGSTGDAQLVNYRVSGHFYVVDRLFDAAELRLGVKKQAIVRIIRGGDARGQNRRRAS